MPRSRQHEPVVLGDIGTGWARHSVRAVKLPIAAAVSPPETFPSPAHAVGGRGQGEVGAVMVPSQQPSIQQPGSASSLGWWFPFSTLNSQLLVRSPVVPWSVVLTLFLCREQNQISVFCFPNFRFVYFQSQVSSFQLLVRCPASGVLGSLAIQARFLFCCFPILFYPQTPAFAFSAACRSVIFRFDGKFAP